MVCENTQKSRSFFVVIYTKVVPFSWDFAKKSFHFRDFELSEGGARGDVGVALVLQPTRWK